MLAYVDRDVEILVLIDYLKHWRQERTLDVAFG
jgi:hypothetical protein